MTPFALPDELIRVRIRQPSRLFSKSDLLEVIESSELRIPKEDIKCQYFGKWSVPMRIFSRGRGQPVERCSRRGRTTKAHHELGLCLCTLSVRSHSGGCQFQNITYDTQLLWKRETVKNAFAHFSSQSLPAVRQQVELIGQPGRPR